MKKEGNEENQEEKHTIRRKEAKSNLEEGGENQPIINKRRDQPPNKVTTRSTSPETIQTSWMLRKDANGEREVATKLCGT